MKELFEKVVKIITDRLGRERICDQDETDDWRFWSADEDGHGLVVFWHHAGDWLEIKINHVGVTVGAANDLFEQQILSALRRGLGDDDYQKIKITAQVLEHRIV